VSAHPFSQKVADTMSAAFFFGTIHVMLKRLEIAGFKSFAKKTVLDFSSSVTSIVGPNGSGKSNVAEAFRFALGEQSMKSMRGKRSEDLIFSGSHSAPRANRAAVAIVFDNRPQGGTRPFKLDFDEVVIERAVFRDGSSEYLLNGSKVRLRDVQELLAAANIGETGHHIISQGEADRVLLASAKERRALLEDALGLKAFEFKKQEAERKLVRTEENAREVESLRREIAPHVRFLAKQVEKLDRAEDLRKELVSAAQTYCAIEDAYVRSERTDALAQQKAAQGRADAANAELAGYEHQDADDAENAKRLSVVQEAERTLDRILRERGELARELGRVEGALESAEQRAEDAKREEYVKVSRKELAELAKEAQAQANLSEQTPAPALHAALVSLRNMFAVFFKRYATEGDDYLQVDETEKIALTEKRDALNARIAGLGAEEEKARHARDRARQEVVAEGETGREVKHRILELAGEKAQAESEVSRQQGRLAELVLLEEELNRDRAEVLALAGSEAASFVPLDTAPAEDRRVQEDRKRNLERLKIRLEEAGGTGEDVRREYKEASEREAFLARELEDLTKSAASLRTLLADLDAELSKQFVEGLAKVNQSFGEFFTILFGGGGARLTLEELSVARDVEEEDEEETPVQSGKPGIEITVNLPKKKVQSLVQLSGGERALTSIALIFAMSQVNPPPFLILDETDAALDEANSRRYADMIESLAKKSQLVVVTHNRETMSRAGILYGVTMSSDGISKLLSVKFEEAVAVAK